MDYDVVVAGSGPVGLMLACELRLAGVSVLVVDRLTEPAGHDRAGVLHTRTVECLDIRGLLEGFKDGTDAVSGLPFAGIFSKGLDHATLDTGHPYSLLVPQSRTEELLAARAAELGVPIRRGHEVVAVRQDPDGVSVGVRTADGGEEIRAAYLVGCDGGRSTVRRLADIPFPGFAASVSAMIGYVTLNERDVPRRWQRTPTGVVVLAFPPDGGMGRVVVIEYGRDHPSPQEPVTLPELRAAARRVYGRELDLAEPVWWMSRFSDATRQAERYRSGRVLLAGDAAHIHFPIGGQGLNTGVHDAMNLGWKLAAQINGWAPDGLLDSYHDERHRAGERVLLYTRAQLALMNPDEHHVTALREVFEELLGLQDTNRHLTAALNGLDVRYGVDGAAAGTGTPVGEEASEPRHPLDGLFAPDLVLEGEHGTRRLAQLLHGGRGVLVDLTDDGTPAKAARPWDDRIDVVRASRPAGAPAEALLVRPDGHVAWAAGDGSEHGLREALVRWFGHEDWR